MSILLPTIVRLNWAKLTNGNWPDFESVILPNLGEGGVYVIWQNSPPRRVVRLGQGIIAQRLPAHRSDPIILRHRNPGLHVTWAVVPTNMRDGVERYLANRLNPLVGDAFPDCEPIAVNLPGE